MIYNTRETDDLLIHIYMCEIDDHLTLIFYNTHETDDHLTHDLQHM